MSKEHPLRRILRKRQISQHQLALELGITDAHLCKVLRGQRRFGVDVALRASALTGISIKRLFEQGLS